MRKALMILQMCCLHVIYEGYKRKTFMNSIALQPHVVDQAYMPNMKAMYVPFHMVYSSLTCY